MGAVSDIRVTHFKSIIDTGAVNIDDDITTIVGKNAVGKSNFLDALTLFSQERTIEQKQLCNYTAEERSEDLDDVVLVYLSYRSLEPDEAPYLEGTISTGDFESDLLSRIDTDSIDSQFDLSSNSINEPIFRRYASGKHTIAGGSDITDPPGNCDVEYEIKDFLNNRLADLKLLAKETLSQVDNELYDVEIETPESDDIQDIVAGLETAASEIPVEDEGGDDDERELGEFNYVVIKNDLEQFAEHLAQINSIQDDPLAPLPSIFRNITMEPIEGRVPRSTAEDLSIPYRALMDSIGVLDELPDVDFDEYEDQVNNAESEFTRLFNGFWKLAHEDELETNVPRDSGEYSIELEVLENNFELYITDGTDNQVRVDQQSHGIRWLLSFLGTVILDIGGQIGDEGLIVLDDPGIHFHPEAETLLYREFEAFTNSAQVIFCTHSPFLINNQHDERIRIMRKEGEETTITENLDGPRDEDVDTLAPVRAALGAEIRDFLFGAEKNVLVEGPSDKQYLTAINDHFRVREEWTAFGRGTQFVTVEGAKETYLARLLDYEEQDFVILKDDDGATSDDDSVVSGKYHKLGDSMDDDQEYDIEELLDKDLFYEVLDEVSDSPEEHWRGLIEGSEDPRGKALKGAIKTLGEGNIDTTKTAIAIEFCNKLDQELTQQGDRYEEMLENFQRLILDLKNRLED